MMGSAQLEFVPAEETGTGSETQASRPKALRQEMAERLAAHRQRRDRSTAATGPSATAAAPRVPRHRAAAAVAERYAHTPSYRAFLAEQAKRAIEEAAAAAEVAMRNAEAVAAVQQELLGELELWNAPQEFTPETAKTIEKRPRQAKAAERIVEREDQASLLEQASRLEQAAEVLEERRAGLTVRLYEDLRQIPPAPVFEPASARAAAQQDAAEAQALDDEIAFRQSPVFEEFWMDAEPPVPLPANLLEFPRQLVAARKARPRLAEGPLREESAPRTGQLRIFEVEPEQISTTPAPVTAAPEWSSIRLDAHSMTAPETAAQAEATPLLASLLPPQTAPLSRRTMASVVDGIAVLGATLAFVAVFAWVAGTVPGGVPALVALGGVIAITHLLYQVLFFTLSTQTPGMRYARIGLCTFSDENPTRSAMRRRVLAQMIALCPLGLGLLWVFLDDDGLGWHDRISRMYQRAY